MEWFHNCPHLVKNIRKINMENLKFCGSSAKKKWNNKIWLYLWLPKIIQGLCQAFFYDTVFESLLKKILKMLYFVSNFCICLIFPDNPFVEEIYCNNPKLHEIMSWLNITKKYIYMYICIHIICRWKNIQVVKQVVKADIIKQC